MKIYLASSWRNPNYEGLLALLRRSGYVVYDFKNPQDVTKPNLPKSRTGFSWSEIDPDWNRWNNEEYLEALKHPVAQQAFDSDFNALKWADVVIMAMPCGSSASIEMAWAAGAGKPTAVYISSFREAELMVKVADLITSDLQELWEWLHAHELVIAAQQLVSTNNNLQFEKSILRR